jgi:hypothetical protein
MPKGVILLEELPHRKINAWKGIPEKGIWNSGFRIPKKKKRKILMFESVSEAGVNQRTVNGYYRIC